MNREQQIRKTLRYLAAFGNSNILWGHIRDIESNILTHEENRKEDIVNAPHFAAWIRLFCELISNSLFDSYYKMTLDEKCFTMKFKDIIKAIRKEHESNPSYLQKRDVSLEEVLEHVRTIIDMRHCFQHGGLPNVARRLLYTTPEKINELLNPSNFESIRQMFLKALEFTATLPKRSVGL